MSAPPLPELSEADLKKSMVKDAKAMNIMEGKDKKGDVRIQGLAGAMAVLSGMVPPDEPKFEFTGLHLGVGACDGKTVEDVHRTFLLWSQKPEDRESDSFNVSKAFRRLTAFADYLAAMFDKYFATPVDLGAPDIVAASRLMELLVPRDVDAETGAVMWIMDMSRWDMSKYGDLSSLGTSHKAVMRWFFSFMVRSMWDEVTATEGVVIVQMFGSVGLRGMLKAQGLFKPIEDDMNKLFYGVMPLKMKKCYLVGCPWWLSALMACMRLFISKKMSQRIKNIAKREAEVLIGGPSWLEEYVPRYAGFANKVEHGEAH